MSRKAKISLKYVCCFPLKLKKVTVLKRWWAGQPCNGPGSEPWSCVSPP